MTSSDGDNEDKADKRPRMEISADYPFWINAEEDGKIGLKTEEKKKRNDRKTGTKQKKFFDDCLACLADMKHMKG